MLVLTVKEKDEKVYIQDNQNNILEVVLVRGDKHRARIGFVGDKFKVYREEVFENEQLRKKKESEFVKKFAKSLH